MPELEPTPTPTTLPRNRRTTLVALLGIAALSEPAIAQMGGGGGGGGGGRGGHQSQASCPEAKSHADARPADASPPRDLVAAFAKRLKEGVPELAVQPPQQTAWRDFVDSLTEVGQHNERRLQRILFLSTAAVSASSPLTAFIDSDVSEGEDRQQALQDLKAASGRLDTVFDQHQRAALADQFVATRSELQAARTH